jgi:hypothetical protein
MASSAGGMPRVYNNEWIVGTLVEHGTAPYHFEEGQGQSYFVRLRVLESEKGARTIREHEANARRAPIDGRTEQRALGYEAGGERVLWGTDLKRAIELSKSQVRVGQRVAARVTGREPVDLPGRPAGAEPAYRNLWEIETPEFINQRRLDARVIVDKIVEARREGKGHPFLPGMYMMIVGAELVARKLFREPEDQERFVQKTRDMLKKQLEDRYPGLARSLTSQTSSGNSPSVSDKDRELGGRER